jgi:DNA-binding response OmpR family regulator
MKVLVAEDDTFTRKGLVEILEGEGYTALEAADGGQALEVFGREAPDFVCLDIMMPKADGYEVCRRIRSSNPDVPIIFISAKGEEIDKVVGLELGADDFIVKPFGMKEVIARIRAVTRRCLAARTAAGNQQGTTGAEPFQMDDLEVFPKELRARRGDQVIDLSLRDVRLLSLLHRNPGRVLDRNEIFNECWGVDYLPSSRTLDQHVSVLRKRVEADPKNPKIITTVHGVGYRYDGNGANS